MRSNYFTSMKFHFKSEEKIFHDKNSEGNLWEDVTIKFARLTRGLDVIKYVFVYAREGKKCHQVNSELSLLFNKIYNRFFSIECNVAWCFWHQMYNGDVDNDYEMKKGIYEYFSLFSSLYEKQRRILIRYLARFLCFAEEKKVITWISV